MEAIKTSRRLPPWSTHCVSTNQRPLISSQSMHLKPPVCMRHQSTTCLIYDAQTPRLLHIRHLLLLLVMLTSGSGTKGQPCLPPVDVDVLWGFARVRMGSIEAYFSTRSQLLLDKDAVIWAPVGPESLAINGLGRADAMQSVNLYIGGVVGQQLVSPTWLRIRPVKKRGTRQNKWVAARRWDAIRDLMSSWLINALEYMFH